MCTKSLEPAEHHRRSISIGGTKKPANISYVKKTKHDAWHAMVGNMNAYQICDFFDHSKYKPGKKKVICSFIGGTEVTKKGEKNSKNGNKISRSWRTVFGNLSFEDVIAYVNSTWLDPCYHFYIEENNI